MINGIPVIYSKQTQKSIYPGGSTEGIQEWIGDAAIACERENHDEWIEAIKSLDDSEFYQQLSEKSKTHIDSLNLFTEASRISGIIETFSRQHPVAHQVKKPPQENRTPSYGVVPQPRGPVGFGFSNGQLRIRH
jgi:hypothetical protein